MHIASSERRSSHIIAIILATCLAALGIAISPLATGRAHATDCSSTAVAPLTCVAFVNVGVNKQLDVQGGNVAEYTPLDTWQGNGGENQVFSVNVLDGGKFQIIDNLSTAYCLGIASDTDDRVVTTSCQETASQYWYLEPYGGGFLIRSAENNGVNCMDSSVDASSCTGANNQVWYIGDLHYWPDTLFNDPAYTQLAMLYGEANCATDTSYCQWVPSSTTTASYGPATCIHDGPYLSAQTAKYTESETSSYSETVGTSIQTQTTDQVQVNLGLSGYGLSFGVQYSHQMQQQWGSTYSKTTGVTSTWSKEVDIPVQPGDYSWVVSVPKQISQTGQWEYDPAGFARWNTENMTISGITLGSGNTSTSEGTWSSGATMTLPAACGGTGGDPNVALGQHAWASSVYSNNYAINAVDGNTSDEFASLGSSSGTAPNQWWEVDLGQQRWITKPIQISGFYAYNFQIWVSNYSDMSMGHVVLCTGTSSGGSYSCAQPTGRYRYVKVVEIGGSALAMAEVRVFGY